MPDRPDPAGMRRREREEHTVWFRAEAFPEARVTAEVEPRFREAEADLLVSVDFTGEETDLVRIARTGLLESGAFPKARRRCYPYLIRERDDYSVEGQRALAEEYRDRIGDRLYRPEEVPEACAHLVQDDLQRVERVMTFPCGGRVLEVGCSDGSLSLLMAARPAVTAVLGVDIAESAIAEATAAAARQPPEVGGKVTFRTGVIEELDEPDGAFTTICAYETLEHLGYGQLEPALDNLTRMLAPDGQLLVSVPNRFPHSRYADAGRSRWKWPNHLYFFSEVSLRHGLARYFAEVTCLPLWEGEAVEDGVYLLARCRGKRT